jgi:hypothetical protein
MAAPTLEEIITTLVITGFNVADVDRFNNESCILDIYRFDKLGGRINYSILITTDDHETAIVDSLLKNAQSTGATPLVLSDTLKTAKCKCNRYDEFFGLFGGLVNTGLILIPSLAKILDSLGHNKLYSGLSGEPDDLHELYVKECLQYMLQSPTRRYGIQRSFEKVPDAVVMSKEKFMILVDSKAYESGFYFQADDMRRFKDYVEDFRNRYSPYFGDIATFLVVSGEFTDSEKSLQGRSDELYQMCGCKMSFLESNVLGKIVHQLNEFGESNRSITWKKIMTNLFVTETVVEPEIRRIKKDMMH